MFVAERDLKVRKKSKGKKKNLELNIIKYLYLINNVFWFYEFLNILYKIEQCQLKTSFIEKKKIVIYSFLLKKMLYYTTRYTLVNKNFYIIV